MTNIYLQETRRWKREKPRKKKYKSALTNTHTRKQTWIHKSQNKDVRHLQQTIVIRVYYKEIWLPVNTGSETIPIKITDQTQIPATPIPTPVITTPAPRNECMVSEDTTLSTESSDSDSDDIQRQDWFFWWHICMVSFKQAWFFSCNNGWIQHFMSPEKLEINFKD
jgi:hypothetical protein